MMKAKPFLLAALLLVLLCTSIYAVVPNYLRVQGKISDASAYFTGAQDVEFRIYSSESGPNASYLEQHTGLNPVPFSNGWFDVNLGLLTPLDLNFRSSQYTPSQYYLGITVGTDGEMAPRLPIRSSPFCFSTNAAYDLNCTNCIEDADIANNLTIVTPNDFNVLGTLDVYDLNVRTLAVGSANQPSIAGDINISGNLEIAPGKKLVMPGTPFVYWISAAEYTTQDTNKRGDGFTRTSSYRTTRGTIKIRLPSIASRFNSDVYFEEISLYFSGLNGADANIGNIALVQNNMGSDVNGTTTALRYEPDIASGTSVDLNSTNLTGMPYKMLEYPYSLNVFMNVSPGQQIDLRYVKLEYRIG
ncbi:MAG: hypothetical protein V1676_01210 [Candidatus Diapherotrites archaeon]